MSTDERIRSRSGRQGVRTPMMIFGSAMTAFYLGLGGYILLEKSFLAGLAPEARLTFAGMLLIYGVYRGWRIFADFKYPKS